MFTLATDTCCDELKIKLEKDNIEYIKLTYMENEKIFYDDFSTALDYISFYDELKQGHHYKTAGVNPYDAKIFFKKLLKEKNEDIVFVSLSSGLSGSFNQLQMVADELNEKNEKKVYVVDSKSATQGQRIILDLARKLRDMDFSASQAKKELDKAVDHLKVFFFVSDIDFLKDGGRISPLSATACKMLQIHPLLKFDEEGRLAIIEKPLGIKKAIKSLCDKAEIYHSKTDGEPFYIANTCNDESVLALKVMLEKKFTNVNIITGFIGPVVGSHTGPNALGLLFLDKDFVMPQKEEK